MNELNLKLECYPLVNKEDIDNAVNLIKTNSSKWDHPFFMDVYAHSDVKKFEEIINLYLSNSEIKNVIILGTGGSIQTMLALQNFSKKRLIPITSSRPLEVKWALDNTTPKDSVVIPISRAGNTLDVNSVINLFREYPIIALSSSGQMYELVKSLNATIIPVPDLSGRFAASVCSVALVPSLVCGIDVNEFMKGMDSAYAVFKALNHVDNNLALKYATYLYNQYNKGYRNIFSMPYSSYLEGAVGLFIQEISESSGKEGKGMLGTGQAAPLCQHSVLELLLGGSKGHSTPLLWTTSKEPVDIELNSIEARLKGMTGLQVINYQANSTFEALLKQKVPTARIDLPVSIYNIGQLIAWIQSTVYYFCLLLDVNWSSNPLVNTGKKICNEAIEKKLDEKTMIENRKNVAKDL